MFGGPHRHTKDRGPYTTEPRPRKGELTLRRSHPYVRLAPYETPRRSSTIAPTPEATSVRVATQVSGPTSGGPPVVGSALAVAVGLAVALAVAVGLALMPPSPYCCAKAAEASSRISTALTANTSKIFFIKHLL